MKDIPKYKLTLSLLSTFDDLLTDILVDQVYDSPANHAYCPVWTDTGIMEIVVFLVQDSKNAWAIPEQSENSA